MKKLIFGAMLLCLSLTGFTKGNLPRTIVTTDGEPNVLKNLQEKSSAAESMFELMVRNMNEKTTVDASTYRPSEFAMPSWIGVSP